MSNVLVREHGVLSSRRAYKQRNCSLLTAHCSLPTIHLQWFSDDAEMEGRTEEPTEHKIQRLKEEGQVVKSQELVGALGLFLPALLLLFLAPSMLRTCVEMLQFFFQRAVELDPVKDRIVALVFFRYLARLTWPILSIALVSALFSNIVQTGLIFTTKPLVPDLTKIIPRVGQLFRRAFSIDGFYNFGKSLLKMFIIGGVAFILIRSDIEKLINLQKASLWTGLSTVASLTIRMLLICAVLMIALSIPDFFFQRWRFRQRHKMSRQELKEEMRMYEADPQVQSRIRGRFRDLLRQNLTTAVPRADVVITNPTHLAVALEYQASMSGPMVTALGADEMAARIRRLAEENGVPMVENKPLAQALYRESEVGSIVPAKYLDAIVTIYRKVMDINKLRRMAGALSA
jgi:flagellar biosynthetic protein FlhB